MGSRCPGRTGPHRRDPSGPDPNFRGKIPSGRRRGCSTQTGRRTRRSGNHPGIFAHVRDTCAGGHAVTDMTSNAPGRRPGRRQRTLEFHIYFALIFFLAIPFGVVQWILGISHRRTLNLRGPLARAWAEADRITPIIFSV